MARARLDLRELKSSMADFRHRRKLQPDSFKVVRQFWSSLVDVAGRSDWQSPLYLALAPLALLRPGSRRPARLLWLFVAYLFLTWWFATHRLDRFWLPILPALAILAGLGADWSRTRAWSVVLVARRDTRPVHEPDLHHDGAAGLERVDRRPGPPPARSPPELESAAGALGCRAFAGRQTSSGRSGRRVPPRPRRCL